MPSELLIGPDGGPFVVLDEDNGVFRLEVPNDEIDIDTNDLQNVGTLFATLVEADSVDADDVDVLNTLTAATADTDQIQNQDYNETVQTLSGSGTLTVDLSVSNLVRVEATGDVTIEFSNVTTTPPGNSVTIYLEDDDGTGPHTITWPASVVWTGGDVESEIEANDNLEVSLLTDDGGTEFRARRSGRGFE